MRNISAYEAEYERNGEGFELYQAKYRKKKILEILGRTKPKRILEIGCGMDPLFLHMDWDLENYTLVEPGNGFFFNAVKKITKKAEDGVEKEVTVQTGHGLRRLIHSFFPYKGLKKGQFDAIICSSLLHEVENPQEILQGIAALCTEDTFVHINVPNADSFHRRLAEKMDDSYHAYDLTERNRSLQQHRVYDRTSLRKEIEQTGLTVIEEGDYFIKPFTHGQMEKMLAEGIIEERTLDGFYALAEDMPGFGSEIYVNCRVQSV